MNNKLSLEKLISFLIFEYSVDSWPGWNVNLLDPGWNICPYGPKKKKKIGPHDPHYQHSADLIIRPKRFVAILAKPMSKHHHNWTKIQKFNPSKDVEVRVEF